MVCVMSFGNPEKITVNCSTVLIEVHDHKNVIITRFHPWSKCNASCLVLEILECWVGVLGQTKRHVFS